jgi:hypothetical protein
VVRLDSQKHIDSALGSALAGGRPGRNLKNMLKPLRRVTRVLKRKTRFMLKDLYDSWYSMVVSAHLDTEISGCDWPGFDYRSQCDGRAYTKVY